MGGVIVALPLTSGPVALFLVLEQGPAFAASASLGSMAGALAQGVFCLGYSALAARGWPLAFAGGAAAFALTGLVLQRLALPLIPLALVVAVGLAAAMVAMPRGREARRPAPPPAWDIPARMVVATALVLVLTAAAAALGPRLSGLLATFPVYAGILAVFGHHQHRLQAMEHYQGRPIAWGLGNFVWPLLGPASARTAVAQVRVDEDGGIRGCLLPAQITSSGMRSMATTSRFSTRTPPLAIAPIASSSCPGDPSLRTTNTSSGAFSALATSAPTGTPPRGRARIKRFGVSVNRASRAASARPAPARSPYGKDM